MPEDLSMSAQLVLHSFSEGGENLANQPLLRCEKTPNSNE